MTDLHTLVAGLQKQGASLQLDTTDLCFLAALHVKSQSSLDEELLFDVYEQVCDVTEPGAANPRKRATHALQRLREQRLLGRVDGAGLVKAGEYAMTRLGTAIVEFFLHEEVLTRESLTLLTKTLLSQLSEVLKSSKRCESPEDWDLHVTTPLQVTVKDLISGIERRQRGMDAQQEEIRTRIGELLQSDWFAAVEACEDLLTQTAATLRELHEVLLQDATQLQNLLAEIEFLAPERAAHAARHVSEQVDRVSAWGQERLRAWSDYFQFVQRYLRSVVRLDPKRAVSQRLRELLAEWPERPWRLVAAEPTWIRLMREPEERPLRPRVARPARTRERPPEVVPVQDDELEALVREALSTEHTLSGVVQHVLPHVDRERHFPATGRIADQVARVARPSSPRERQWVPVDDRLEIEEWTL